MKTKLFFTTCIAILLLPELCNSQGLKDRALSAEKIYVKPFDGPNYFVTVTKEVGTMERTFDATKTYQPGDTYFESGSEKLILGSFDQSLIEQANQLVLDKCREFFGSDRIVEWPSDMFKTKYGLVDHKAVDSDYYIIFDGNITLDVEKSYNETKNETKLFFGESTAGLNLKLYERQKAGKAGKKAAASNIWLFKSDDLSNIKYPENKIEPTDAVPLIQQLNGIYLAQVQRTLDKFFEKVETGK